MHHRKIIDRIPSRLDPRHTIMNPYEYFSIVMWDFQIA
jgi:hypothetical protein